MPHLGNENGNVHPNLSHLPHQPLSLPALDIKFSDEAEIDSVSISAHRNTLETSSFLSGRKAF